MQVSINTKKILDTLNAIKEPLVIEGAGGLLVPLNEKELVCDLIKMSAADIILVARSTLGTINHSLLSLEALKARGLKVKGVIMVGPLNLENKRAIEAFSGATVIGEIPWLGKIDHETLLKLATTIAL